MSWLSKIFGKNKVTQSAKLTVLGASGAGKTTFIQYLETGEPVLNETRTTLGIDVRQSEVNIGGWSLSAIDVGGQDLYRESLWSLGVSQADAIIYLIDGTVKPEEGKDAFERSKFAFDYMLSIVDEATPILILVNKQDLVELNPLAVDETIKLYDISSLIGRSFNILPSSAKYGDGIETAINWLIGKIRDIKATRK